ncbi:TolC family protein [Tahibacter amnicola]|uniref:TolC family protein n=1 Tax=Tahibacter amnicola TaxID=2976241 RepID=A0ABY6B8W9_9GAMM|nr:TolC family protein [Tahibacter amnicola]UXI66314.1 TolC family protein [Tahibacter amnicola]
MRPPICTTASTSPLRGGWLTCLSATLLLLGCRTGLADAQPITFFQALESAAKDSAQLAAQESALAAAEATIGPAGQLPDPELILGIENLPVEGEDAFRPGADFMTMRRVGLMQALPARAKRDGRAALARATAEQESRRLAAARLALQEAVAHRFIAARVAQDRLELLLELRPRTRLQLDSATAALSAGGVSAADAVAARSAVALLEDRIDEAAQAVALARADLARWLPDIGEQALGPLPDIDSLPTPPERLLERITHHRELLAWQATESVAEAELSLARLDKRADWSVELAWSRRGSAFDDMVSVQLRVGLPLFAHQRQDPTIQARRHGVEKVQAERRDREQVHRAELQKAASTWQRTGQRLQRYTAELLPLADDRFDSALAAYRGGRADLRSALVAHEAAIELRLAYVDLRAQRATAWATLRFAEGGEH